MVDDAEKDMLDLTARAYKSIRHKQKRAVDIIVNTAARFESKKHSPVSVEGEVARVQYYPIELQFNTFYDRQLNNYLHDYVYKKEYPEGIGGALRELYEKGKIRTLDEFKEVLENVLHSGEGHK